MGISVLLGTEHKQLEENIMKILLAIGWLLVLAFVYEADAGTIDARNEDDRQFGQILGGLFGAYKLYKELCLSTNCQAKVNFASVCQKSWCDSQNSVRNDEVELTQPKDLQDCLEKAGSSSQKAIEDCLHVSDVQFAQIKKMAKCLDGQFKTLEEIQTKITECLAANPTRVDSSDLSAEKEDRQIVAGIGAIWAGTQLSQNLCRDVNCEWKFCPKRWCTGKFFN